MRVSWTEEYTRDQIPKLWSYFENDLERLSLSYENDTWHANPTPLCGYCPVSVLVNIIRNGNALRK
jgi:hypothetical protein